METRQRIGECDLHILGTVQGFIPDGLRVHAALTEGAIDCVALGIPPEDLPGLAALAEAEAPESLISDAPPTDDGAGSPGIEDLLRPHAYVPQPRDDDDAPFIGLDETQKRFLELIGRFGATRIPSPDLNIAYLWARDNNRRLEAIDLDDEAHASAYIKHNKFRHILRSGRVLRKLAKQEFKDATDAHDLALRWDAFQNSIRSLAAVEQVREEFMATRLRELAKAHKAVVVVLQVARFEGVVSHLQAAPS